MPAHQTEWTAEMVKALPDDGKRYEVLDANAPGAASVAHSKHTDGVVSYRLHTMERRQVARSKTRTRKYDTARYLKTERDVVGYLEAAFEDGHPLVIAAALGDVARARGMSAIARKTGLSRESLYKALAPSGNPQLSTFLSVIRALGLTLRVVPERA
jgi:probable addiction module antidote protein